MSQNLPPVSAELVAWLERTYPDRLPSGDLPSEAVMARLVGQQDVVRRLRNVLSTLSSNVLTE